MVNYYNYNSKYDMRLENINDFFKIINHIWWKFAIGKTIRMQWPSGLVVKSNDHCNYSSDPNYHWRPWLEENVGRQYIDWDWNIGWDPNGESIVIIKFRKYKIDLATQFILRYENRVIINDGN